MDGQEAFALVHQPLSRAEIAANPKAKEALLEEASTMRSVPVWDETQATEVDSLLETAQESGEHIHIAEVMPMVHKKNAEMPKEFHRLRGRLVFRGDECRDEFGVKAIYREVKSLPATIHSINLVLYFGMLCGHMVTIADAAKAYLQAPLKAEVPTWVIIPKLIWHDSWFKRFKKVACPLLRAMYGHTTAGDDWYEYFDGVLVGTMRGTRMNEFPSVWYFPQWKVLVAAYVDDVIASGPQKGVNWFWSQVRNHITFDEITTPGRYLGRDHFIMETMAKPFS